jgi:hypothetical protein
MFQSLEHHWAKNVERTLNNNEERGLSLTRIVLLVWILLLRWPRQCSRYGLDGPGIESRRRRGFPYTSKSALRPTQPPEQWKTVISL